MGNENSPASPSAKEAEIFFQAMDWKPEERDRLLGEACGGDGELESRIRQLLAADREAEEKWPTAPALPIHSAEHPEKIGKYEIIRLLGSGGMGTVYEAQQTNPQRRIALKVLRSSQLKERILRRFETEAQVLGLLTHPGIAQVYETSVVQVGDELQPCFAMELVEGKTIDEFAYAKTLPEQVELLAQVCDAVQHAHQKRVVHRDIKPGNVLVTHEGHPKIVDFGVAHVEKGLLDSSLVETHAGEILGTLAYMSPEQIAGDPSKIDARSDVYSLGVLGYRLVAKCEPLQLQGLPITEISRRIANQEPRKVGSIVQEAAGDLETILAKAMAKEPRYRYASAGEFASDLRRYSANEPILARPATTGYYLRKFVARNRALVGGLTATFLALVAGFATSTWLYLDARKSWQAEKVAIGQAKKSEEGMRAALEDATLAAELAKEEQVLAEETADFVTGMFEWASPFQSLGKPLDAQSLLVEGATRLQNNTEMALRTKSKLALTLSRMFDATGNSKEGLAWGRLALEWMDVLPNEEQAELWRVRSGALHKVATMEASLGQHGKALQRLTELHEFLLQEPGASSKDLAQTEHAIADLHSILGDFDSARKYLQLAEPRVAYLRGEDPALWIDNLTTLGTLADLEGRSRDHLEYCRQAYDLAREHYGDDLIKTQRVESAYISALEEVGEFQAALEIALDTLRRRLDILAPDHYLVLETRVALQRLYKELNDRAAAWEQANILEEHVPEVFGELSDKNIANLASLANLCVKNADLTQALAYSERAVELARRSEKLTPNARARTLLDHAYLLLAQLGRTSDAKPIIEDALHVLEDAGIRTGKTYLLGQKAYALCLQQLGDFEGAESVYGVLLAQQRIDLGENNPDVAETLHNMALLANKMGLPEKAVQHHEACLAVLEQAYPPGHPLFGYCYSGMGENQLMLRNFEKAEVHFRQAVELREAGLPSGHFLTEISRMGLAGAIYRQSRVTEAKELLEVAGPILRSTFPEDHFAIIELDKILGQITSEGSQ